MAAPGAARPPAPARLASFGPAGMAEGAATAVSQAARPSEARAGRGGRAKGSPPSCRSQDRGHVGGVGRGCGRGLGEGVLKTPRAAAGGGVLSSFGPASLVGSWASRAVLTPCHGWTPNKILIIFKCLFFKKILVTFICVCVFIRAGTHLEVRE